MHPVQSNNVDRRTVTHAQHLLLGRLAMGSASVDDFTRRTRISLMSRGLIDAASDPTGDLVFDAEWNVVYELTTRGWATVRARHLWV